MPADASWRIASASVTGTSHEAAGAPCQDAHQVAVRRATTGPLLIIAVSDGAGTACAGEVGARTAVSAICEQAEAWFAAGRTLVALDRTAFSDWLCGVREQIAARAEASESDMRDFACTLLVAIIAEEHAAFAQLGDGAMVALTPEREWSWIFWPQHGPYTNTTHFVTDDEACDRFEFDAGRRRVDEIAVFSDGLEQLVLDLKTRTAHDPFFNRMFPPLRCSTSTSTDHALSEHLAGYLSSPAVRERSNDDVTLVLASRLTVIPEKSRSELVDASDDTDVG